MEQVQLSVREVEALARVAEDVSRPHSTRIAAAGAVLEAVGPEMARRALQKAAAKLLRRAEGEGRG